MTLDPKRLWAKSKRGDEAERPSMHLLQHLKDVFESAVRILDATQDCQLSALGLDPALFGDRLWRCVVLAAAVHDIGKANDHFLGMLLRLPERHDKQQGIRHEWATVLMLKELKAWLLPAVGGSETDFAFVEWAVAGHHPAHNHESPPRSCPPGAGADIRFHTDQRDFTEILRWLKETFHLEVERPSLTAGTRPLVGGSNVFQQLATWSRDAQKRWDTLKKGDDAKLLAAIKNCLIAADVAGSALPRDGTPDWGRITAAFKSVPPATDLEFLARYGLEGYDPRQFQTDVAEHPDDVVFVKAGCGTGKTVAAYMRAANKWKGRRLYFCYPTTGTATEGFKDYLHPEVPEKPTDDTPEKKADRERLEAINADLFTHGAGWTLKSS